MSEIKCRILYVDDHADSSEILKLVLSESDYEVHTASRMDEALQLATTQAFDLYVLDKRLPDGSGFELCRKLNRLTPGVPCIFYTGDAYEIHREEADGNWVEVGPPAAQSCLVIYPKSLREDWQQRKPSIVFECDNIQKTFEEMRDRGVHFKEEPKPMQWSTFAIFVDTEGNLHGLRELPR